MREAGVGGLLLGATLLLPGVCGVWTGAGPGCTPVAEPSPLPAGLEESSGVAFSASRPGVFWTLNDGGEGVLYAVDADGSLLDSVAVGIPSREWRDWEDLAIAPCPRGDCLWVADTGDNYAERDHAVVHRLPEPTTGTEEVTSVESFPFRYPDGPRDVEALFVLPDGDVHLISKGTDSTPTVYRYPPPLRPDTVVTVEEVQRLGDGSRALPRRITGAAASDDGTVVAVRTYETLIFMAFRDGGLHPLEDGSVNLRTLREAQGEAVALGPDGAVVLTSEAGPMGRSGSIVLLRCTLPEREVGAAGETGTSGG